MRVAITVYPFNVDYSGLGKDVLVANKKYTRQEMVDIVAKFDPEAIIAGTEKYDKELLDMMPNLKIIARAGIGYNGIDFKECRKRGIMVSYTPDAPSVAVAELIIGQLLSVMRLTKYTEVTHTGNWKRHIGREVRGSEVGIIGHGRIGKLLEKRLKSFQANLYINDINKGVYCTKEYIYRHCNIISVNVPLTDLTYGMIGKQELSLMPKDCVLINTSRGGIVNEEAICNHLAINEDFSYICDVFENEPYHGPLTLRPNAFLTPHIGSCTETSRYCMESGALHDVVNFMVNIPISNRLI